MTVYAGLNKRKRKMLFLYLFKLLFEHFTICFLQRSKHFFKEIPHIKIILKDWKKRLRYIAVEYGNVLNELLIIF